MPLHLLSTRELFMEGNVASETIGYMHRYNSRVLTSSWHRLQVDIVVPTAP
jgi:hypothetical protein